MALNILELESLTQKKMIEDYLSNFSKKIDLRLAGLIPVDDLVLFDAVKYSLLSKGKRLRPILTIAACDAFNVPYEISIDPACCIEMVHTYSLVHDDLPCMDDDDYRRGKPTLHLAYNEAIAVLSGDFLLTYPFEVLSSLNNVTDRKKNMLIKALAKRAGGQDLIAGQVMDLMSEGKQLDLKALKKIYQKKTASMITLCLEFAAILGDANHEETTILQMLGEIVGVAFQIQDDILDLTSTSEVLGKPVKSDVINKKATYVASVGVDKASSYVLDLKENAVRLLKSLNRPTSTLGNLIDKFLIRCA